MLMKTPLEPPRNKDDDRRRRLESLLGATVVNLSQTPPHKIISLSPKLSLSFSKHSNRRNKRKSMVIDALMEMGMIPTSMLIGRSAFLSTTEAIQKIPLSLSLRLCFF
ncbi:hypothetical protein M5K25_016307 [Dendrobium thyrsiflorum]|uniref:Uncharacterized protein n=1 Tax=Dendrobium thyrsiflorum TaxID=117978 RepID=A0ABD0UJS5_DENTH